MSYHNSVHRYFCSNCGKIFKTGLFEGEEDDPDIIELYDDICPNCGAPADTFRSWLGYKFYKLTHRRNK